MIILLIIIEVNFCFNFVWSNKTNTRHVRYKRACTKTLVRVQQLKRTGQKCSKWDLPNALENVICADNVIFL